ncbi:hypothetical protein FSP39_004147 [Pinctada imbricata]|uniref:Uncharacterized protein n=1 Tax=Pinctada imbricata TaxID=66713 RepID=A0AA88XMG9_PINIB|nr:hypothetical protein FSP39_004147 [Pinctada imbricata]
MVISICFQLLDTIIDNINQGRTCLAYPKRKSIEELVNNSNMQSLYPQVPNDVALSFYIHASKLVLSVYQLNTGSGANAHKSDITARQQVECTVSWLNECVMLLTMALQHCQQLKDKVILSTTFNLSIVKYIVPLMLVIRF